MKTEAFSLVEIIIVVSIIGVLFAATSFGYDRVLKNSRDTKRRLDVAEIANAVEKYNKQYGEYPFDENEVKRLLNPFPSDPISDGNRKYEYKVNPDRSSYTLTVQLELSDSYYVITPQGKMTVDTMITPFPSITIPNDDPAYPTTLPTITTPPTPTVIYPTWAF